MNIKILYDNSTLDDELFYGWGFSCLINDNILFDTGENGENLLSNMNKMKVDILNIEKVVISHDHWDHTGGLWELLKNTKDLDVYGCPGFSSVFKKRVAVDNGRFIENSDLKKISDNMYLTEKMYGIHKFMPIEEQALIIITEKGITVITGCAHPGILKILEIVKKRFPEENIHCVLGGFHLTEHKKSSIENIAKQFRKMNIQKAAPCHCSGEETKEIFKNNFGNDFIDVNVGEEIEI
ncbi:MAG: MBL fold metallo-hydrolase [Candidatus Aureabacteria bacterium]|nr:MBL fold metallo-hydrolase [Candidatus Auribacterota bacterium]